MLITCKRPDVFNGIKGALLNAKPVEMQADKVPPS